MIEPLIDPFGRAISYLRLSVTDRCDLRCTYCMAEDMTFLPKAEVLSLEELARLARAFIRRGVRKIRLTGGEPLVRRGIMTLIDELGAAVTSGELDELTLTTNATQLSRFADGLARAGVQRINVSLDSLRPDVFARVTRNGDLAQVLDGLTAAQAAGLKIKLNVVALKHDNVDEIPDIVAWAHERAMDVTLIEVMPLGDVSTDRLDQFMPLSLVRDQLEQRWTLTPIDHVTGGPSRYVRVDETGGRLGFITPLTNNFCAGCNRVRVTCTGQIYMCLGQSDRGDLRAALRASDHDAVLDAAIEEAIGRKPERHDFETSLFAGARPVARHMSVTGG